MSSGTVNAPMPNEDGEFSPPAVMLRDLVFAYDTGNPVLDVPEITVSAGERLLLHGASGSGKSTLLGLLAGVIPAQQGEIHVLGHDLRRLSGTQRDRFRGTHVGYIFQLFNLIPYLNAAENIALPCWLNPERLARLGSVPLETAVAKVADQLDIAELLDRNVTRLSVGQQQRVAAARALLGAPGLILADEPTSSLDADRQGQFLDLLFRSCDAAGATLILVSHDRRLRGDFDRELALASINQVAAP